MNIIFCVPGRSFSSSWLKSWNETIIELSSHGHSWGISNQYDPVVYYARNRVLGGDNTRGMNQKPFNGTVDYDYMIWIDSDIVWTAKDIISLISHDKDIVSGCYVMQDNNRYPIVENLDFNLLSTQGTFNFLDKNELKKKHGLFKANYVGFGFLAVKKGVFESMDYPWFKPRWVSYNNFHDFTSEDVAFSWTIDELGYDIWVDPTIKVGHEKSMILI